jgi:hypothetical protein
MYTNAVDVIKFFKGIGIAQEVSRDTDRSTVCRLILGSNSNYKAVFFNVNRAREIPSNKDIEEEAELMKPGEVNISELSESAVGGGWFFSTPAPTKPSKPILKIGGEIDEDKRMTMQAFNSLIQQMVPLQGDLCPQRGQIVNPFDNQMMPNLSCPGLTFGGKKRTQKRRKTIRKRGKSRKYKK